MQYANELAGEIEIERETERVCVFEREREGQIE